MHNFSPQSKVWVYQSDRPFTADEETTLNGALAQFTQQWTAHNQQLKAIGEVRNNRFIILMVDETQAEASGCSIDKSVHFIKEVESHYGVALFNRLLVSYEVNGEVRTTDVTALKNLFETGEIHQDTLVFNALVTTKEQLDSQWQQPIGQTWMKRYLPKQTLQS